mmetsp:Transcript_332/g.1416  ORF Transcript_332/g.1416 Transcript_332/m.1416 type:complete len:229 (-) Transcript_332:735-1421(-)
MPRSTTASTFSLRAGASNAAFVRQTAQAPTCPRSSESSGEQAKVRSAEGADGASSPSSEHAPTTAPAIRRTPSASTSAPDQSPPGVKITAANFDRWSARNASASTPLISAAQASPKVSYFASSASAPRASPLGSATSCGPAPPADNKAACRAGSRQARKRCLHTSAHSAPAPSRRCSTLLATASTGVSSATSERANRCRPASAATASCSRSGTPGNSRSHRPHLQGKP